MRRKVKDFALLNFGTLLVVVGVYFFKFPNHFSTGGVTGIAVVAGSYLSAISPGTMVLIINALLMVFGFVFLGKGFGVKSFYASALMSAGLWVLERVYPMTTPLTDQPLLELVFAVALPSFGSALLFNMDASTGGTDIVAMMMKKYTSINIGKALFLTDVLITLSAVVAFGITTGLFSILGLLIKSLMIDSVIENINQCKYFNIVCQKQEEICEFIVHSLHRGATVLEAQGAFTHNQRYVVLTVMNRAEAVQLRRFVKKVDPYAFVLITNTSEIIGRGFRGQT